MFATRTGRRLSPDAVQRWVTVHVQTAAANCPSLQDRKLSPHVFRHTNTMNLLHAGVETTVIALWLGHADVRSTNAYLHADLAIKERALARIAPISTKAVDTGRQTNCSRSSKPCEYADHAKLRGGEKPKQLRRFRCQTAARSA